MSVYSFDIDLTLQLPEDTANEHGAVPIRYLRHLQTTGHIVGTCSDREPSNQRDAMQRLGFSPDFCIPKELLDITGKLLPGARLVHVGDDDARDREIAERGRMDRTVGHGKQDNGSISQHSTTSGDRIMKNDIDIQSIQRAVDEYADARLRAQDSQELQRARLNMLSAASGMDLDPNDIDSTTQGWLNHLAEIRGN